MPAGVLRMKEANRADVIAFLEGHKTFETPLRKSTYPDLLRKAHEMGYVRTSRKGAPARKTLVAYIERKRESNERKQREATAADQIQRAFRRTLELRSLRSQRQAHKRKRDDAAGTIKRTFKRAKARSIVLNDKTTIQYVDDHVRVGMHVSAAMLSKKYDTERIAFTLDTPIFVSRTVPLDIVERLIKKMIERVGEGAGHDDRVKFYFNSANFASKPVNMSVVMLKDLSAHHIAEKILRTLNSNEFFDISSLQFGFLLFKQRYGAGRVHPVTAEMFEARKKSLIVVKNHDNRCFVLSLSIALKRLEYKQGKCTRADYKKYQQGFSNARPKYVQMASSLYALVGLQDNSEISLNQVKLFERALKVKIHVFDYNQCLNPPQRPKRYEEKEEEPDEVQYEYRHEVDEDEYSEYVCLHYHHNHFNCITNPATY